MEYCTLVPSSHRGRRGSQAHIILRESPPKKSESSSLFHYLSSNLLPLHRLLDALYVYARLQGKMWAGLGFNRSCFAQHVATAFPRPKLPFGYYQMPQRCFVIIQIEIPAFVECGHRLEQCPHVLVMSRYAENYKEQEKLDHRF